MEVFMGSSKLGNILKNSFVCAANDLYLVVTCTE